jgi:hypothetical protein
MNDEIVTKNRGVFGRVQIAIPMPMKNSMMDWMKKSGMGRAEFFRVALIMGVTKLAKDINAIGENEKI